MVNSNKYFVNLQLYTMMTQKYKGYNNKHKVNKIMMRKLSKPYSRCMQALQSKFGKIITSIYNNMRAQGMI